MTIAKNNYFLIYDRWKDRMIDQPKNKQMDQSIKFFKSVFKNQFNQKII
jgi:hypothetical protein